MVNEPPDSKQAEAPRPLVGAEQGREKKPHVVQWAAGAGGAGGGDMAYATDHMSRDSRRRALAAVTLLHFRRLVVTYEERKKRAKVRYHIIVIVTLPLPLVMLPLVTPSYPYPSVIVIVIVMITPSYATPSYLYPYPCSH